MEKSKPDRCPFCGFKEIKYSKQIRSWICAGCGGAGPGGTKASALKKWNLRYPKHEWRIK